MVVDNYIERREESRYIHCILRYLATLRGIFVLVFTKSVG